VIGNLFVDIETREGLAGHDLRGEFGDRDASRLRDERDGTRGARIRLEDVDLPVANRKLDVQQPLGLQRLGDVSGDLADALERLLVERARRDHTRGVAG